MRRFTLVLCAFVALTFIFTNWYSEPVAENTQQPAASVAEVGATAEPKASADFFDELSSGAEEKSSSPNTAVLTQLSAAEANTPDQEKDLRAIAAADDGLTTQAGERQAEPAIDPEPQTSPEKPVIIADAPRAAQEELKRLGCYAGRIDGIWGRKSRRAVRAFNRQAADDLDRQPDSAMVLNLRNYPDAYCTNKCRPNSNRPECEVASAKPEQNVESAGHTNNSANASYLPPWMRGEDAVLVEDEHAVWGGSTEIEESEPVATQPKAQPRRVKRNRVTQDRRRRAVQQRRRAKREVRSNWGLQNWPGGR